MEELRRRVLAFLGADPSTYDVRAAQLAGSLAGWLLVSRGQEGLVVRELGWAGRTVLCDSGAQI